MPPRSTAFFSPKDAAKHLDRLAGFFDPIIISEVVGIEKPDPAILQLACDGMGIPAGECLYVGDHPLDVLCAKQAGMDIAWICDAEDVLPEDIPFSADCRIGSAQDILALPALG